MGHDEKRRTLKQPLTYGKYALEYVHVRNII